MIAASRRRREERADAFRLHHELAARSSWSTRLRRGAALALAASVVALLMRAGLTQHLLAVAAGFVAGAVIPVRGAVNEALESIRRRAGLSYETALALASADGEDEFGLRSSVVERARLAVRDVRPEPAPAWWLPVLAVAVGLTLFSLGGALGGPGSAGGTGAGGVPGGSPPAAPEAPAGPEQAQEDEVPTPPEEAPGRAADEDQSGPRDEDGAAEGQGATPPGGDGSGQAPLSRFLDSLRERPDEAQAPEDPGAPGGPGAQPPRSDGPASPTDGQGEAERAELERAPGSPDEQSGQEPREGAVPEGQGEGEGEEEGQTDGAGQDEQAAGDQPGDDQGAGDPQAGEQPGGQGAMPDAGGEPGESEGEQSTQGMVPDDGSSGADPEESAGAGAGGGETTDAGAAEAEGGDPELLPGVLQDGPENPAGTVRLPGDTDVQLPPGRAATDYQAAAEEALSEGDLPLAYQEIIRQYFQ